MALGEVDERLLEDLRATVGEESYDPDLRTATLAAINLEETTVVADSDRIISKCANFSILKEKTDEEAV